MMQPFIVSDLKRYVPAEALSMRAEKAKWRVIEYETAEFSGSLLFANTGANAPPLSIDPALTGWHTIKIGLWNPSEGPADCQTQIRLSGDGAWTRVSGDGSRPGKTVFIEAFWKHADMTGQKIRLAQPQNMEGGVSSCLAYLIFEPLSAAQVEEIQADRANPDTKRLIGTHDMHFLFYSKHRPTIDDFMEELEPYRHTDFETLHFECPFYNDTGMSWSFDAPEDGIFQKGDVLYARNLRYFQENNLLLPAYRRMAAFAREMGKRFYISYRMNAFVSDPPFDNIFKTSFYENNPQWRCKDADGRDVARMSYAFPEVQEQVIQHLLSLQDFGGDGIALLFHRCFPYVMYEKPATDRFIAAYGIDPRFLPEDDPRWLDTRADIMTEFIRKLRAALDAYGEARALPRPGLAAYLLVDSFSNRMEALDGRRWAAEGLVDEIIAFPLAAEYEAEIELAYYADMVKGTNTKLYINLMPRQMEPAEYRAKALEAYEAGAYGIALWDSYQRHITPYKWSMAARLGHAASLARFGDGGGSIFRQVRILRMAGKRVDRYWATMGL